MKWREAVLWILAAVLCAAVAVMAAVDVPPYGLQVDLRASLPSAAQDGTPASSESTLVGRLNINEATVQELTALPGVGEVLAQRIVDYREHVGGFTSVEQLGEVEGIGEKRLAALQDLVCIS